jgi:hypothetical protein
LIGCNLPHRTPAALLFINYNAVQVPFLFISTIFLTIGPVPTEVVHRILKLFGEQDGQNGNNHVVLASRLFRVLQRRSTPIQLLDEEMAEDFFWSAEEFHSTFKVSLPQITFCEVRILELHLPAAGSDLFSMIPMVLDHLSLLQFNLVMDDDSIAGTKFTKTLKLWVPHLRKLEILRIKYHFWKPEDVSSLWVFAFISL